MKKITLALMVVSSFGLAETGQQWRKKMHQMAQVIGDLMPEVTADGPSTPENRRKLERLTRKLSQLSHGIKMGTGKAPQALPPDSDPSISFISSIFDREIKHAHQAIQQGHTQYAKSVLRMVSGYCVACHTRSDMGPEFPTLPLNPKVEKLEPMQKAQIYAATRQFDRALDLLGQIVVDQKFAQSKQLEWGKAVRQAFNLAVRVKHDPQMAEKIATDIRKMPAVPSFYLQYLGGWEKSITDWKGEKGKKLTSEENYHSEVNRLLDKAKSLQKYPMDHSADILYLRASGTAHEQLSKFPHGKRAPEAFLALGTTYEILDDRTLTPLPQMAYEACIRSAPHTATAADCYHRFEQQVYFGYTGSGGTSIPTDMETLLKELKGLAKGSAAS